LYSRDFRELDLVPASDVLESKGAIIRSITNTPVKKKYPDKALLEKIEIILDLLILYVWIFYNTKGLCDSINLSTQLIDYHIGYIKSQLKNRVLTFIGSIFFP